MSLSVHETIYNVHSASNGSIIQGLNIKSSHFSILLLVFLYYLQLVLYLLVLLAVLLCSKSFNIIFETVNINVESLETHLNNKYPNA